jgi:N-acetylneuraminic acid mutarotase
MSTTRVNHTATLLPNGKVLVVGGTGGGPVGPLASAEIYDPVANTWSPAATLPAATYGHTATLLADGRVLIAGGTVLTGPNSYALASSALVYDPSANTWASTGSLSHPRYQHTATLLSNGSVLITGGADGGVGVAAGTTEIYNPATNSWSPGGTLLAARESHTASLLPSGRILLAGGTGPTTSSSELYDPATNTSVAAASLIAAGYLQSATLLSNGAVLVVGGRDSSDNLIASPELYW